MATTQSRVWYTSYLAVMAECDAGAACDGGRRAQYPCMAVDAVAFENASDPRYTIVVGWKGIAAPNRWRLFDGRVHRGEAEFEDETATRKVWRHQADPLPVAEWVELATAGAEVVHSACRILRCAPLRDKTIFDSVKGVLEGVATRKRRREGDDEEEDALRQDAAGGGA